MLCDYSDIGKSFIAKHYCKTHKNVVYIYIVGYDGMTGEEIRIKASDMVQKGELGASADIQFSANAENWHFPALETDIYVRFRVGLGTWSVCRFFGLKGDKGEKGDDGKNKLNSALQSETDPTVLRGQNSQRNLLIQQQKAIVTQEAAAVGAAKMIYIPTKRRPQHEMLQSSQNQQNCRIAKIKI